MNLPTQTTDWSYRKLNELGKVSRGRSRHRPRNDPSLYGGKYPFVQTADVKAAEFYLKNYAQTYNEKGLAQSKLWDPGTLCITIAANIADTAVLALPACFPDSIVGFIANPDKADVRFVKYYIDTIKLNMQNISKGTTQDNLSVDKLLTFSILTPPIHIQRKIAAILSAYDDLIENNTQRIKILEEMAQTLYREWFVRFRFPGHEKVEMVDSPMGKIPEGWEAVTIKDASSYINRGVSPKYDDKAENIVINQKCIRDKKLNLEPSRRHLSKVPQQKFAQFGDILINSTGVGTLGRVAQIYQNLINCTVDSHVSIVRPGNNVTIDYFGLNLLNQQDHFESLGTGSTGQAELNRDSIANTNFLLPPKSLQLQFSSIIEPMRKSTIVMLNKNANLRHTRDLLLPKLISGELSVENLEIKTED